MSVQKLFSIKEAELCCVDTLQKIKSTTRSGPWISLPSEAGLVGFVSPMGFLRHQAFGQRVLRRLGYRVGKMTELRKD